MKELKHHMPCPWCGKGETLSDGRSKVTISNQCPKCGRVYLADLDTLKTMRFKPQRRQYRRV